MSIMRQGCTTGFLASLGLVGATMGMLAGTARAAEPFTLTSSAFADGAMVAAKYAGALPGISCGGENISPPLAWSNAPAATKSFAIVMFDPDGGRGTGSSHWVAYDIPASKTSLAEGEASKPPTSWTGGKNSRGINYYYGPCGPSEDSPHHYVITLIATDIEPGQLPPGLTRDELLPKLRGHALAPATIVGKYVRPAGVR
jgi:Raf kinase inhibitor-like YbhB/YbcL family protein